MNVNNFLLIILLILFSGAGLFYYRLYISRKKAYFLLTEENEKILVQIKALEEGLGKLNISEGKLQETNRTKDRFFSIISHDLKGPLNSLTGLLQILMKYADSFSKEELKDFGRNMNKSVHNLLDLLDNLFQWSQSQSGSVEYRPQALGLSALVNKTVNLLEATAQNKNISIRVDIEPYVKVYADANMISFIVRNLLSNAIKFTNKEGVVLISSIVKKEEVEISVSDNGVGMSKEVIEKLFKIDSCHTTNGTENEMGTGLGLILCKEFVQKNGGKIEVESEYKKGTTFRFRIPVVYEEMAV